MTKMDWEAARWRAQKARWRSEKALLEVEGRRRTPKQWAKRRAELEAYAAKYRREQRDAALTLEDRAAD
jgi:hypothetical protein